MKLKPIKFGDLPVGAQFHTGKRPQKVPAIKKEPQPCGKPAYAGGHGGTLYNYFRPKHGRPQDMNWGFVGTWGAILDGSTVYVEVPSER